MKKLLATLFIAGSAISLSACETITAGNADGASSASSERVFREAQSK